MKTPDKITRLQMNLACNERAEITLKEELKKVTSTINELKAKLREAQHQSTDKDLDQ